MEDKSDKKSDKKQNLGMLAIVAIVAIISLVVLFNQKQVAVSSSGADEAMLGQALDEEADEEALLGEASSTTYKGGLKIVSDTITIPVPDSSGITKHILAKGTESVINLYINDVRSAGAKDEVEWCVGTTSDTTSSSKPQLSKVSMIGKFSTKPYKSPDAYSDITDRVRIDSRKTKITATLKTSTSSDGFCVKTSETKGLPHKITFEASSPKKKRGRYYSYYDFDVYIGNTLLCGGGFHSTDRDVGGSIVDVCKFDSVETPLFNTGGIPPACGNGVVDAEEACDITTDGTTTFGSVNSCTKIGGYSGGTLGCSPDCTRVDISSCT